MRGRHFIIGLAIALAAETAVAQSGGGTTLELKDPDTARQYAMYFVGGGHFYTGEYVRAGAMLGVTIVGIKKLTDVWGCSAASDAFGGANMGCEKSGMLLWLGVSVAPYIYGIIDARSSAERANAKLRTATGTHVMLDIDARGRLKVGLSSLFR